MPKSIITAILALAVLLSIGGNEIYKNDIGNRLIIQGIGIDLEEDNSYTVTVQAINTNAQSASTNETVEDTVKIYKVSGMTVQTAIKRIFEYEGHIPMYSQNRIIVIGKKIAETGIYSVIDFFARDADNGPSVYVAMAKDTAAEILEVTSGGEIVAKNIDLALQASEYEAEIYKPELYEVIREYYSEDSCFALPVLYVNEESGDKKSIRVKETALFCDGKYNSSLTRSETAALNFLCDDVYNGTFAFKTSEGEKVSMNIVESETERKVKLVNGALRFSIKISVTVDVAEIYDGKEKEVDLKRLEELKNGAQDYLKNQAGELTGKLYSENVCDVPGYSRLIYQKYPSFYRENKENLSAVMSESSYSIEVSVKIRRVGHENLEVL